MNLESFTIFQRIDCDATCSNKFVLENLSKSENLKNLYCHNCNLTLLKFNALKSFVNLKKLHITANDNCVNYFIDEDEMCDLVKALVNLRELKLHNFDLVSSKLFELVSKIKKNRGDSYKLKIILKHRDITNIYL